MAVRTQSGVAPAPRLFLLIAGAAIATFVTNLYIAQPLALQIATDLRLPPRFAGLVVSASQFGYGFGMFAIVPLADRIENRRLVMICAAVVMSGLVGVATANGAAAFMLSAFVVGTACSGAQVLIPYLSHVLPEESRGRALGSVMAIVLVSVMLTRPAALFGEALVGWRGVYWISAGLTLLFTGLLARHMSPYRPGGQGSYAKLITAMFGLFIAERRVVRRSLLQALLFAAFTMFWAVAPIVLLQRFNLSEAAIGLFALAGAGAAFAAPLAGRAADAGWEKRGTIAACVVLAAAWLLSVSAVAMLSILAMTIAAVLIDAAVQTSQTFGRLIVLEVAPDWRGRVNALYMTIVYFSGAVGSIVGVALYAAWGWNAVTAVATILALIVAIARALGRT